MSYYISIQEKEQYDFLKRVVENLYIRMHGNVSGYAEHLDTIDALKKAFDKPYTEEEMKEELLQFVQTIKESLPSKPAKPVRAAKPVKKMTKKRQPAIADLPVYCENHPHYTARRSPRTDCQECWAAYQRLNPNRFAVARRDFLRKQRASE